LRLLSVQSGLRLRQRSFGGREIWAVPSVRPSVGVPAERPTGQLDQDKDDNKRENLGYSRAVHLILLKENSVGIDNMWLHIIGEMASGQYT
jgi:hypothetical protein